MNIGERKIQIGESQVPFHLFMVHNDFFLFDTSSERFYNISKDLFDFLKLSEKYSFSYKKARIYFSKLHRDSTQTLENILSTTQLLFDNGLWDIPAYNPIKDNNTIKKYKDYLINDPINTINLMLTDECNLACKYCFCESSRNIFKESGLITCLPRNQLS